MGQEKLLTEIETIIAPIIESLGYELIEREFTTDFGRFVLRLYIDQPEGITVSDCQRVTRAIDPLLESHDLIKKCYYLEVSSPGIERPLRKKRDFERYCDNRVKIKTTEEINKRKNFTGKLSAVENNSIIVDADGNSFVIPLQAIAKARLVA